MLQRINFAMMLVVLVIVAAVSVQVFITQRYNTLALNAITAELVNMKYQALGAAREAGGQVYLEGGVKQPGVYQIPTGGTLTLRRLATAAGGFSDSSADYRIVISSLDERGEAVVRAEIEKFEPRGPEDVALQPDDHVRISKLYPPPDRSQPTPYPWPKPGQWRCLNAPAGETWSLEILEHDDVRGGSYRSGSVSGILRRNEQEFHASFDTRHVLLSPRPNTESQRLPVGNWAFQGEQILLNVYDAIPDAKEPLLFEKVTAPTDHAALPESQAQTLGRFILRIFAAADPHDPAPHETMRRFLAQLQDEIKADAALSASTRAMMQELIRARRKILDYDKEVSERLVAAASAGGEIAPADRAALDRQALAQAQLRNQALQGFIMALLTQADPGQETPLVMREVLDAAAAKLPNSFADDPELAAQLREMIERTRTAP